MAALTVTRVRTAALTAVRARAQTVARVTRAPTVVLTAVPTTRVQTAALTAVPVRPVTPGPMAAPTVARTPRVAGQPPSSAVSDRW